jgi:hypothetical protein
MTTIDSKLPPSSQCLNRVVLFVNGHINYRALGTSHLLLHQRSKAGQYERAYFSLEARIIAGDAPAPWGGGLSAGLALLLGREGSNYYPRRSGVPVDGMTVELRQRQPHQIPDDRGELCCPICASIRYISMYL